MNTAPVRLIVDRLPFWNKLSASEKTVVSERSVIKYFAKGDLIALTGSIQTRKYEDKDGNKRTAFEVLADDVSFCSTKKEKSSEPEFEEIKISGDLPF